MESMHMALTSNATLYTAFFKKSYLVLTEIQTKAIRKMSDAAKYLQVGLTLIVIRGSRPLCAQDQTHFQKAP